MKPELQNLKGGQKQAWLRLHHKEVRSYYAEYGAAATMLEFNLEAATLERFLSREVKDFQPTKLSEADRWVLRISNEGLRDLRHRIVELEDFLKEAEPVIKMGQGIIATLAQLQPQSRGKQPKNGNTQALQLGKMLKNGTQVDRVYVMSDKGDSDGNIDCTPLNLRVRQGATNTPANEDCQGSPTTGERR